MNVVIITRANVGRVTRWRGERSGTHTYLQALLDEEWCQVVVTRSDPPCLPPRSLRLKVGEYMWSAPKGNPDAGSSPGTKTNRIANGHTAPTGLARGLEREA